MKPCEILFSQGRLPAAARSQSSTSSYAASIRTDTSVPPNDVDGDIDCTGAAANMSHRYASNVAEHTCSAKLAEAKAEACFAGSPRSRIHTLSAIFGRDAMGCDVVAE